MKKLKDSKYENWDPWTLCRISKKYKAFEKKIILGEILKKKLKGYLLVIFLNLEQNCLWFASKLHGR